MIQRVILTHGAGTVLRADQEVVMAYSLRDMLRFFAAPGKKKKSVFQSEKEAYDFCRSMYNKTGGVTPELQRAFEFYQKNINDECRPEVRVSRDENLTHSV